MTLQTPPRERPGIDGTHAAQSPSPEVLFEEARRRRRRRWMAVTTFATVAVGIAALLLGGGGGGAGGVGATASGHAGHPGSGASSGHPGESRLPTSAPASGRFYTGPGASCPLAPHNRYLPRWSGCVTSMVADLSGNGRPDLVITYSRLRHVNLSGLPPRSLNRAQDRPRYAAEQAMLRIVTPDGRVITSPIRYRTAAEPDAPITVQRADAATLLSTAHLADEPGRQIILQVGQISSGSNALIYSLYRGHLVPAGALLGYGGDAGSQAGFRCVTGSPRRVIQRDYELIRGLRASGDSVHIYGWWRVSTVTYGWRGPRLVALTQASARRRLTPDDSPGAGCGVKRVA